MENLSRQQKAELKLYKEKGWQCVLCDGYHGTNTMCQADFYDASMDNLRPDIFTN